MREADEHNDMLLETIECPVRLENKVWMLLQFRGRRSLVGVPEEGKGVSYERDKQNDDLTWRSTTDGNRQPAAQA